MRFVIYGAGGIGGVLGARLFQSGAQVVLIARGPHYEALQRNGLHLRAPGEDVHLEIPVVDHPARLTFTSEDVVVLCMKSQHTAAALEDLRMAAGSDIPVVCCQNGVANEREALRRFNHVYGMVVILPAMHLEPGAVITHAAPPGNGVLDVGRYPRGIDQRAEDIARAVSRAGFACRPDPAVMRQKYAKLLMNLNNALQAATEMADGTQDISRMMRQEALACYAAAGIDCASADESREQLAHMRPGDVPGTPRSGGSSWQSIMRGTGNVETDYLNGEIVLLGRLHGVPTPANTAVQQIGVELIRSGGKPGSVAITDVLARIAAISTTYERSNQ
jgi:2-dehydropantoate 2-reductase